MLFVGKKSAGHWNCCPILSNPVLCCPVLYFKPELFGYNLSQCSESKSNRCSSKTQERFKQTRPCKRHKIEQLLIFFTPVPVPDRVFPMISRHTGFARGCSTSTVVTHLLFHYLKGSLHKYTHYHGRGVDR